MYTLTGFETITMTSKFFSKGRTLGIINLYGVVSTELFLCHSLKVMFVMKCLYLTTWKTISHLEDYFSATFSGVLNVLFSIYISIILISFGGFGHIEKFKFLSGCQDELVSDGMQRSISQWYIKKDFFLFWNNLN